MQNEIWLYLCKSSVFGKKMPFWGEITLFGVKLGEKTEKR